MNPDLLKLASLAHISLTDPPSLKNKSFKDLLIFATAGINAVWWP